MYVDATLPANLFFGYQVETFEEMQSAPTSMAYAVS